MLGPLDVPGEIALFGEGLIALRTLVRLLTLVDTSDMILAGVLLREFLGTNLTTERLLTPVDTSDMSLEVSILREFLRTNLTAERLLLGVGSDVSLEFRGFGKYFLTMWTDLVLSHGNISFLSF